MALPRILQYSRPGVDKWLMARSLCASTLVSGAGLVWAMSGCGSGGDADPAHANAGTGGQEQSEARLLAYEPCAEEQKVGEFVIELASAYTSVRGKVEDAVSPNQVPHTLQAEGACRLLKPPRLLCDPGCAFSTETCAENNECVPLPNATDVGTVTVGGLLVPVQMQPNPATKNYVNPATPRLPQPGFQPGAALSISTSGGDYLPFELRGWGVSLLDGATNQLVLQPGAPMAVAWQTPSDPGPAHLHMNLEINVHGSNKAWVECDVPDTGSAQIPASLVDALFAEGRSGFPTLTLTRRTANSRLIEPGCVQLLVSSEVSAPVEVPGIVSCEDASSCDAGQVCLTLERYCQ
jgi:hypothetical protein